jgi:hypothetical protein
MKPIILIILISCSMLVSCYKPYNANIDANKKILVVDGLITNENTSYQIRLSYALPFDSSGTGLPANASSVSITDDEGNYYAFNEMGNGYYMSDSFQFRGKPGSTYTLHINTVDGERYESDPQQLYSSVNNDSVYAEFGYQEVLNKITGSKVLSHGANILTDIKTGTQTLPHFRFTTNLVTQYINVICTPFASCNDHYCWQTENANLNINLTGGEYPTNSDSENKHVLCFIDDNLYCYSLIYYRAFIINSRVIYSDRYVLNDEAYLYYKKIDELLRSEGKIFDPVAAQINGNIKCITHPENKVFGFFEASTVSHSSYKVDFRNLNNTQPSITRMPYILPPEPTGSLLNIVPPFWVN